MFPIFNSFSPASKKPAKKRPRREGAALVVRLLRKDDAFFPL